MLPFVVGSLPTVASSGCAPAAPEPDTPPLAVAKETERGPRRSFSYQTLEGRRVTARSYRGRMTVIALVATYDTASQAQARFLETVYRRHTPRVNVLMLALEPEKHRPLVEAFKSSLELSFDVAMADAATIAGEGPFPGLHHVPSTVLLDREGYEVWRNLGVADAARLSEAIDQHDDR